MNRRRFLQRCSAIGLLARLAQGASPDALEVTDDQIRQRISESRPSRSPRPAAELRKLVGSTHVAGRYHLTDRPFLLEGAEKLLSLGTRVGKFWFTPHGMAEKYPFNSRWGNYKTLVDLAQSDYFRELFALPFATIILEVDSAIEHGWAHPGQDERFYAAVQKEFKDLTAHLYRTCSDRPLTIILQNWEGDWLLRGRAGELWKSPPHDWRERCARMVKWLTARQTGVTQARTEFGAGCKCTVAHAAEVNRVTDAWQGIPTMTREVLPQLEVDLVSYSSYDGLRDPLTLWKCIAEIRKHARTTPLFGRQSFYIGEVGIPENDEPERLTESWDEWMGVFLAAEVRYVVQWELYCNEAREAKGTALAATAITDPARLRGFWLVKPDGTLSETGRYFAGLWKGP